MLRGIICMSNKNASIDAVRKQLDSEAAQFEPIPVEEYEKDIVANGHMVEPTKEMPVTINDFFAYMPSHDYIFTPTRELWPASSVNTRCEPPRDLKGNPAVKKVSKQKKDGTAESKDVALSPSEWLDQNRPVDQMAWAPGKPMVIFGQLVSGGGWIKRDGCACFNLYRPPVVEIGDSAQALRWIEHIERVFPDGAAHIIPWLAHRVQRPGDKINHALVLGGAQGIGKDTILEPVKYAVGPWNFAEVSPAHLLGRFNGFVKSVILRISEARDMGDVDRYGFYEHTKVYTAAPRVTYPETRVAIPDTVGFDAPDTSDVHMDPHLQRARCGRSPLCSRTARHCRSLLRTRGACANPRSFPLSRIPRASHR
jgi:hypothetical protein